MKELEGEIDERHYLDMCNCLDLLENNEMKQNDEGPKSKGKDTEQEKRKDRADTGKRTKKNERHNAGDDEEEEQGMKSKGKGTATEGKKRNNRDDVEKRTEKKEGHNTRDDEATEEEQGIKKRKTDISINENKEM